MREEQTLDCQDCGRVLFVLTAAQAQQVGTNPYNFVEFCSQCSHDRRVVEDGR